METKDKSKQCEDKVIISTLKQHHNTQVKKTRMLYSIWNNSNRDSPFKNQEQELSYRSGYVIIILYKRK